MTTEAQTTESPSNGADGAVVNLTSGLYPFDAQSINIDVPIELPADGSIVSAFVSHSLRKALLKDHVAREEAIKRVSKRVSKSEFVTDRNEDEANSGFYDSLVEGATGHAVRAAFAVGDGEVAEITNEYPEDECKTRFTFEVKSQVYKRAYPNSYTVVDDNADPFASLFEKTTNMFIRQDIGGTPAKPAFSVIYEIKPPSKSQRIEFGRSVQITEKYERASSSLKTSLSITKGVNLFSKLFVGVKGGMVNGKEFEDALRNNFLAQIDPMFQYAVIDAAVASFDKSRDS